MHDSVPGVSGARRVGGTRAHGRVARIPSISLFRQHPEKAPRTELDKPFGGVHGLAR